MAAEHTMDGVPLSTLCPKFLHSNSTSHTWPFSAIAELIDNAYDPDVDAKQIWIDKTQIKDQDCLTFMDNGNGLCYDAMHKMLSFGYSDKKAVRGKHPIGMYGNGFKSGSMRLGKDAIVLSKSKKDLCVGMLSQSYLEKIGAKEIIVPLISIKDPEETKFRVLEEHRASLRAILDHSPFNTEEELLTELKAIQSTSSTRLTNGTRIIIWNLRRTSTGSMEFDFTTDRYDVRIPSDLLNSKTEPYLRMERSDSSVPESDVSLRAYCSILYMKPRMQINIRGQKVKTQLISKSLAHIAKDIYKPYSVKQKVPITFGFNTMNKEQYGIMMYHKNRLIKAYERVGCQTNASRLGVGVIGVIECNFLEPTHNKQDFDNTDKYRNMIRNVAGKLEEYCKEIRYKRKKSNLNDSGHFEETKHRPDQNWAQCDQCQQWRRLPDGIDTQKLPDEWFCHMNPDPQFRRCETMEEPEDSDNEQPSYLKTYKIQEKEEKRRQEENGCEETATPKTPQTPRVGASACSPATSSGHPVISAVYSLSKPPPSLKKRLPPTTPQSEAKRQRGGRVRRRLDSAHSMSEPPTLHEDPNNDYDLLEGSSTFPGNGAMEEMRDQSTQMKGPQVKDEEEMNISTVFYDGTEVKEKGRLNIAQAQEQQDQLIDMLQSVTDERDSFKEEVEELNAKLIDLKEKQNADRQTQEGEAREKAEELSKEKEAKSSLLQQIQEQAKQIQDLHLKVKQLEEEKSSISAEFEKNKSSLAELRSKVASLLN